MNGFDANTRAPCAIIYESELDYVKKCILDSPDIETGGELFGLWTATGVPVVLYAIGPGPDANRRATFFSQDRSYLVTVGRRLIARYGIQHVGEWHSHHRLGLAVPSAHDAETMSSVIRSRHLGRFLMGLGNCTATEATFNAFEFVEGHGAAYAQLPWDVKAGASPFRLAEEEGWTRTMDDSLPERGGDDRPSAL